MEKIARTVLHNLADRLENNTAEENALTAYTAGVTGYGAKMVGKGIYESTNRLGLAKDSDRIAILYPGYSSGFGHAIPATAIAQRAAERGIKVDMYDLDRYQGALARKIITPMYHKIVSTDPIKNMPTETIADPDVLLENKKPLHYRLKHEKSSYRPFMNESWNLIAGHNKLIKDLRGKDYQRVISLFGPTADILKNQNIPVDVVTTDNIINPHIWKTDAAGNYFVPNNESKERLKMVGIDDNKIKVTGSLIVRPQFRTPEGISMPDEFIEYRKNPKSKIVTILGGGTGIMLDKITDQAAKYHASKNPDAKIVVIAGKNKGMEQKLKNLNHGNVIVKGHTADIEKYLRHSDLVISRPGGSSTAELLHMGTPVITYNQGNVPKALEDLGAHESANIKLLNDKGMSRHFKTEYELADYARFNPLGVNDPKILNLPELDNILDDVYKNYDTLKENALKTSKEYTQINAIDQILDSSVGTRQFKPSSTVNKIRLAVGAASILAGGLGLKHYLTKRLHNKNDKNGK